PLRRGSTGQGAGYVDVQETRWGDIAGLDAVKATLQRLVPRPLRSTATYRRFGVRPSTGVLLYGPPGTGKTMLARAMATELSASFVYIDLPQLMQAEVGESERRLREFFDAARERSPAVMFIDELQAAFGARRGSGPVSGGRGVYFSLAGKTVSDGCWWRVLFACSVRGEHSNTHAVRRCRDSVDLGGGVGGKWAAECSSGLRFYGSAGRDYFLKIYICVFVFVYLRARGTAGGLRCCGEKEAPCPVALRQPYCFLGSRCVSPKCRGTAKDVCVGRGRNEFFFVRPRDAAA
ncbi:putative ATPase, partial [Trypanosoma conorhini]